MPIISTFFGIVIKMYINDHNPPHFHAEYGDTAAIYNIMTLQAEEGKLPRRADMRVREWATKHQIELLDIWNRLHNAQTAYKIDPLT